MTAVRALVAALVLAGPAVAPAQAVAQVLPARPGLPVDPHRHQAERHRYEMDRLRLQAEQRRQAARQAALEAQLMRQRIEAARQPELIPPPAYVVLDAPEAERAARERATERRRTVESRVGEIDAWLDRRPD